METLVEIPGRPAVLPAAGKMAAESQSAAHPAGCQAAKPAVERMAVQPLAVHPAVLPAAERMAAARQAALAAAGKMVAVLHPAEKTAEAAGQRAAETLVWEAYPEATQAADSRVADCPAAEIQAAVDCLAVAIPAVENPAADCLAAGSPVGEILAAEIPAAGNHLEAGKMVPAGNRKADKARRSDNSVESRPADKAGTPAAAARAGKVCSNSRSNSRPGE